MSFTDHDPYNHFDLRLKSSDTEVLWECESCGGESDPFRIGVHMVMDIVDSWREHLKKSHPHVQARCPKMWNNVRCDKPAGHTDVHHIEVCVADYGMDK